MTDLQSPLKEDIDSKLDKLQLALDVAGIEPTIGTGADAANVIISLLRAAKDKEHDVRKQHLIDAGISAVSMIPFADVVKLIKLRKLRRPAARIARMAKDTLPELPKSYNVEEGSVLQQKPLHNLAKNLIKIIDKFFKEGSPQLEDAKFHGYKKGGWIMGDYISDWGGNATMFLIFPSAQFNPDVRSDEQSTDYVGKSGGYFTSVDQGEKVGIMGKIVLHLDMYIPILTDYKPDVIPSSEYDIRDPKIRKKIYKQFKRDLYQFAYHEAQHAVKRFVYGWEGKPGLGVKYQKYYDQPAAKRGLTAYAGIGDERESILAQIASEVESTIKFDKERPQQLQTLTSTLIVSPSFRRLIIGMLDFDAIGNAIQSGDYSPKEFFQVFWSSGKVRGIVNKFDPFNPNFFKYINPKYHRLYKMVMKKLVQWWRSKFPRRTFRTPLEEYYIPGYTGTSGKSNFREPENFDSYDEGSGWAAYSGGNDWENGITACAVYFDNGREMARIWFNVKVPDGMKSDSDCSEGERSSYNEWGEKASKTWIKEAKKIHKVPREYFSDGKPWYKEWKECFIEALNSEEMEPYVKECGVDQTRWAEMEKESIEENGGSGMFSGNGRTASPSNLDVDRFVDDTSDKLDDFLNEEMTYKDLYLTSDPARVKRAGAVRSKSLRVRSIDEYEAWTFSYKSNPSNSRKTKTGISPRWQGYVKFLKEDVRAGEDAQEIPVHVDCTCPDYMYRWAYNNAQVNAGKIGPDSWNKCISRSPKEDLGQGLCKHLISLESYLRTKIYSDNDEKSNLFESENLYGRFQKFVNENKEFDVAYSSDEPVNEGFRKNKDWFIYDGVNEVKVVFNDGRQLSLAIDYKGNLGEFKEPWRRKAVSVWKKTAKEMYDSSEITEVGNIRQKPWYDCFKEAIETKEMAPFQHPKNASKITFEKKKVTGYQNAPKIVSGVDPVNFTPRV